MKKENKQKTYEMLLEDVEEYKKSGEQMGEEILTLRRSIASYKAANTLLREKIKNLQAYGKVVDEFSEKRIAEIDDLKTTLMAKDKNIEGLEAYAKSLKETIADRDKKIKELKDDVNVLQANYDYVMSLPWYKRIFIK